MFATWVRANILETIAEFLAVTFCAVEEEFLGLGQRYFA